MTFTLDRDGGSEVLKQLCAEAVSALALQVAADADDGAKVAEFSQITESVSRSRFVASIAVPDYRQAVDGALTKAAAKNGLEVKPYPNRSKKTKKAK